ncbi:MAG: phosphoribosylamine--glycine ligase, partial [Candidatus Binataceae bacterium]
SKALVEFAKDNKVELTIVGPEDPLGAGIVDEFEREGLKIFGPTRAAAQLETSKAFAKSVMRVAGVPTADFEVFDNADGARRYVRSHGAPIVVKADGLTAGKGVTVCRDIDAALTAISDAFEQARFGAAGKRLVIEECIAGEELSYFALCDGDSAVSLGIAQDHKPIFDGDQGPNTGGMGAYSPVPHINGALDRRIMQEIVLPTLAEMNRRGAPYRGVMYVGLMIDGGKLNVIEYNARFGDPECEVLMMRFDGDLAETLLAAVDGRTDSAPFRLSPKSAATVVLASSGYPGDYRKGIPITGLERIEGSEPSDAKVRWAIQKIRVKVFYAGTALRDGMLVTDGGRVLAVTAMADDLRTAVDAAYQAADMISFDGKHFRRDIARRALALTSSD